MLQNRKRGAGSEDGREKNTRKFQSISRFCSTIDVRQNRISLWIAHTANNTNLYFTLIIFRVKKSEMNNVDQFFQNSSDYKIVRTLLSVSGLWPFHTTARRFFIYLVFLVVLGSGSTIQVKSKTKTSVFFVKCIAHRYFAVIVACNCHASLSRQQENNQSIRNGIVSLCRVVSSFYLDKKTFIKLCDKFLH